MQVKVQLFFFLIIIYLFFADHGGTVTRTKLFSVGKTASSCSGAQPRLLPSILKKKRELEVDALESFFFLRNKQENSNRKSTSEATAEKRRSQTLNGSHLLEMSISTPEKTFSPSRNDTTRASSMTWSRDTRTSEPGLRSCTHAGDNLPTPGASGVSNTDESSASGFSCFMASFAGRPFGDLHGEDDSRTLRPGCSVSVGFGA